MMMKKNSICESDRGIVAIIKKRIRLWWKKEQIMGSSEMMRAELAVKYEG